MSKTTDCPSHGKQGIGLVCTHVVHAIDLIVRPIQCRGASGGLGVIAFIEDGDVFKRILEHMGLPAKVPAARPARAPHAAPRLERQARHGGIEDSIDDSREPWIDSDAVDDPGAYQTRLVIWVSQIDHRWGSRRTGPMFTTYS
jgi:hypothetical protein